jgi:hemerythrin-like domain-containing protein
MPDVFDVLSQDHSEVKQMLARLEKERPGPDAAKGKLADRKQKAAKLITEESKHEAVEEMFFWPAVRDKLQDGDELAGHATSQENEAKEVLAKLDTLEAGSPEFEELLTEFTAAAREHIEFEETQVWPKMREALSKHEATEMGKQLTDGKKTAPDKPEPGKPVPAQRRESGAQRSASASGKSGSGKSGSGKSASAKSGSGKSAASDTAADKTKSELYEEARKLGVQGRSNMTKEELAREVASHR